MWGYTGGFTIASGGRGACGGSLLLGRYWFMWFACAKGLQSERSNILIGLLICVVLLGQFGVQMNAISSVPRIHNISTDNAGSAKFRCSCCDTRGGGRKPVVL
jgi:hypothetical protein